MDLFYLEPGLKVWGTGQGAERPESNWETSPLSFPGKYVPLPPLPSRCQSDSAVPCLEPMEKGRVQSVGTDAVQSQSSEKGCREAGAVTLLAAWAREAGGTEAVGALAGAPMQTGLAELAGVLLMLTEVSCGSWQR